MKLFSGVDVTDYQDILRALGAVLDNHQLRDVRIWEYEDGLVVQGRRTDADDQGYQTFLLTDEDLTRIVHEAYTRRGQGAAAIASPIAG